MHNQVSLDINDASSHVHLAGAAVEAIARAFLKTHPSSPRYLSSTANQDAIRAMQTVLKVMLAFDKDRSFCPDKEKQLAYVEFVTTMNKLANGRGAFSNELREKQVMDLICEGLGKLFYGRPGIGPEIMKIVGTHVKLMLAAWFSGEFQLPHDSQYRPDH